MKNQATARKAAAISSALLILLLLVPKSGGAEPTIPQPKLVFAGTEDYETGGSQWTRYKLTIDNRSEFPNEMFEPAPDLPPCGANKNSSRSWVDIFDCNGKRLYGFCALGSPDQLSKLWFAVPKGQAPPSIVYIVINDRKLNKQFKSNPVWTSTP
jgi:hypothetical protein